MEEKPKKKGSCFGTLLKIILVIVLLFVALIVVVQIRNNQIAKEKEQEREDSYSSSYWPDTELAALLPEPDSEYGILNSSREDYLSVTVGHVSSDDFQDYISDCKELGYTIDYSESSIRYSAENEEGYDLSLYYDDDDEEMDIRLNAPSEDETESVTTESTVSTEAPVETEVQTEATQSAEMVDGMRVEFKEAMDSYEEFFDSYCEFMVKYAESDNAVSMLSDYMSFMNQYSETMDALDAMGEEDLNDAESAYYTEVNLRITEKLLEATQAIGEE